MDLLASELQAIRNGALPKDLVQEGLAWPVGMRNLNEPISKLLTKLGIENGRLAMAKRDRLGKVDTCVGFITESAFG